MASVAGAPFALAGLAWHAAPDGGLEGAGLLGPCPLLEATGAPCAGCGAARAFYLLSRGDPAFAQYNWFWPLIAAAVALAALVAAARAARGRPPLGSAGSRVLARIETAPVSTTLAGALLLVPPWAVALANLDAIRGP